MGDLPGFATYRASWSLTEFWCDRIEHDAESPAPGPPYSRMGDLPGDPNENNEGAAGV
jgi:hypothetical protein